MNLHWRRASPQHHYHRQQLGVERSWKLMGVRPVHSVQDPPLRVAYHTCPPATVVVDPAVLPQVAIGEDVPREQLPRIHVAQTTELELGSASALRLEGNAELKKRVILTRGALRNLNDALELVGMSGLGASRAAEAPVRKRADT